MKIGIIGKGSFGTFLETILEPHFEIADDADSVILAVPVSAYETVAAENRDKHLINVCSVQQPSTEHLLRFTDAITCIHPLFGSRTPVEGRNAIVTRRMDEASIRPNVSVCSSSPVRMLVEIVVPRIRSIASCSAS